MSTVILSRQLEQYTGAHTTPESPALAALNRETNLKRGDAQMLSGHLQGALLQMLSHFIRPKRILEIGTFTGYSAICMAAGLPDGGVLHTIDIDEELEDIAAAHIAKAGLTEKIVRHIGKAADVIPTLNGPFDLVFIDADKQAYEAYYDLVFDKVPVGGCIIADNVLYDGEVLLPPEQQSRNAKAMDSYNRKITADTRVEQLLLPLRDGLMICRKLRD
jgi:caffeoyl-CoA O-methyltransferase